MSIKLFAKKRDGFTLAEVMVSGFILVLVVASFARVTIASISSMGNARARNSAYSLANETIESYEILNNRSFLNPNSGGNLEIGDNISALVQTRTNVARQVNQDGSDTEYQNFNVVSNFEPVSDGGNPNYNTNSGVINVVNYNGKNTLIRVRVVVSWIHENRNYQIAQNGFLKL